ncbi:MAG: hypothetical protein AB1640_20865 [bacterium]
MKKNISRSEFHPAPLGAAWLLLAVVLALASAAGRVQAFEPGTLKLGTIEIHPSIASEVLYCDNITLSHDAESDVVFKEVAGLSLLWGRTYVPIQGPRVGNPFGLTEDFLVGLYLTRLLPLGERGYLGAGRPAVSVGRPIESAILSGLKLRRASLSLDYEPQIVRLVEHPELNSIDHELSFAGDLRFPGGLYVRLDDGFVSSSAINSFRREVADLTAAQRSEGIGFQTNLLSFTVGYNFYADYAVFLTYSNYLFFLDGFDASQVLSGLDLPGFDVELSGVDSGTLGSSLQTLGIYFATVLRRKTTLSLGYIVGRLEGNLDDFGLEVRLPEELPPLAARIRGDPRDADLQELRLGFQRALTSAQSVFGWPVPKTVLEGSFSFQWRDFKRSRLVLEAAGEPFLELPFKRESFHEYFFNLRLVSQLRPRTQVRVGVDRYPREAVGGSGNVAIDWESFVSVSQGIREKLLFDVSGLVRYSEQPYADAGGNDFLDYQAEASLSYRIQTWLQAGVSYQFLARDADNHYNAYRSHRARLRALVLF